MALNPHPLTRKQQAIRRHKGWARRAWRKCVVHAKQMRESQEQTLERNRDLFVADLPDYLDPRDVADRLDLEEVTYPIVNVEAYALKLARRKFGMTTVRQQRFGFTYYRSLVWSCLDHVARVRHRNPAMARRMLKMVRQNRLNMFDKEVLP